MRDRLQLFCFVCGLLMLSLGNPAGAEDDPPVDCANAQSTHDLNFCADRDFQAADQRLNSAYQKAIARIAKSDGEKPYDAKSWDEALRASQRAWVSFRDADCKGLVPMAWSGGTGTTLQVLGCMISLTDARTKELTEAFEDH